MPRKTTEQFIQKSTELHNGKYDYSLVDYVDAHTKVTIICPIHGPFDMVPNTHTSGRSGCRYCAKQRRADTNIERYGVDNPRKSPVVKQKIKDTWDNIYGGHPKTTKEVQDKWKQTCMEKYNVEFPSQSPLVNEKRKQTFIKRYGVDNPLKCPEIRNKQISTNNDRYGVDFPLQSDILLEKTRYACKINHGTDTPFESKHIRDKSINTNKQRNNGIFSTQVHIRDALPLLQDPNWLFHEYSVLNKTISGIANDINVSESTVKKYLLFHDIDIRKASNHSFTSLQWLDIIMSTEGIYIQHARNSGEYRIPETRYKADGYCQSTNTIYEFYGDFWHGNLSVYEPNFINQCYNCTMRELYDKTMLREQRIKELGYNLVTMWESEFNQSIKVNK